MIPVTTAEMSTKSAPASVRRMAARPGRPPSFLDKRSLSGLMSKARRPAHRIDSRKGLRMAKRATANSPPATTQNALEQKRLSSASPMPGLLALNVEPLSGPPYLPAGPAAGRLRYQPVRDLGGEPAPPSP